MLLVCPTCEASYQIDDSKIGSSGRTVRCKKCATVWFATKPLPEPEPFAAIDPSETGLLAADLPSNDPFASDLMGNDPLANDPLANDSLANDFLSGRSTSASRPGAGTMAEQAAIDAAQSFPFTPDPAGQGHKADAEGMSGWGDASVQEDPQASLDTAGPDGEKSAAVDGDLPPASDQAVSLGGEAIENVAASSARVQKKGRDAGKARGKRLGLRLPSANGLKSMAPYAAFAACVMAVFAVAMREPLARSAPWTGKLFAAIGLPVSMTAVSIVNVRSELSKLDKADVLIVEGELTNRGSHSVAVPPVRISVRDESGTEIYSWSADVLKPTLQGGETSPFRARLASPPSNGRSVAVRFGQASADSQDKAAPKKS